MIRARLFCVHARELFVYRANASYTVPLFHVANKVRKDRAQGSCIIQSAMVVKILVPDTLRNRVQLMVFKVGIKRPADGHGINRGKGIWQAAPFCRRHDERGVKRRVVGNQHLGIAAKGVKVLDSLLFGRCVLYHFVGDACQLGNLFGYGLAGIDKGAEAVFYLTVAKSQGPDLRNTLVLWV